MSQVLVDTSVWVAHFRNRDAALVSLLQADRVLMHPMVLGELACGNPSNRQQTLANLALLQQTQTASLQEVVNFVEQEKLFGLGCGLVDMVLLASILITPGAQLWTWDKRLTALAERYGVGYQSSVH
jgi:predicted nucleic acid-binding protein